MLLGLEATSEGSRLCRVCVSLGLLALLQLPAPRAIADEHDQGVVVLYDERIELPGLAMLDDGIGRSLAESGGARIEVYRETLDLSRFGSREYVEHFREYLAFKYRDKNIDAVIGVMSPSLDFLLENAATIFPGAAIVFCGIDRHELAGRAIPRDITGVVLRREFSPTLDIAIRLHPNTQHIFVVAGTSSFDAQLLEHLRAELVSHERNLEVTYLTSLPFPKLLDALSRLPPRSFVLYSTLFRDGDGNAFVPHEAIEEIARAASAPVYGFVDQYLGRGIVGGYLYSLNEHGIHAGRLARRVLAGEAPSTIAYVESSASVLAFDAKQLTRWGIDERLLPSDANILNRHPTLWNQYRGYVLAAFAAFALQALLIAGLLVQMSRRRQTEAQLRESEQRFRSVADSAPVFIWMSGTDRGFEFVNQVWLRFRGRTHEEERGSGWQAGVHPDDIRRYLSTYWTAFKVRQPFDVEFRARRHDGEYRWILDRGRPRYSTRGEFLGYVGSGVDITERKRAEEAMSTFEHASRLSMMGELSAMIAHEIKQPLAAILTNVSVTEMLLAAKRSPIEEFRDVIEDIRKDGLRANQTIDRLRALSRKQPMLVEPVTLKPVFEDVLSIAAHDALRLGVEIDLKLASDLPDAFADRICLQQVLLNLIKNALDAMRPVQPHLRRLRVSAVLSDAEGIRVSVTDTGSGIPADRLRTIFDSFVTTKKDGTGIGLAISRSLVERFGGTIWAENNVEGGATFHFTLAIAGSAAGETKPEPLPDRAPKHLGLAK